MNSPRRRILVKGVRKIVRNGGEHQRAVIDELSALRLQRVECVVLHATLLDPLHARARLADRLPADEALRRIA